jgi:hypothetical protein
MGTFRVDAPYTNPIYAVDESRADQASAVGLNPERFPVTAADEAGHGRDKVLSSGKILGENHAAGLTAPA